MECSKGEKGTCVGRFLLLSHCGPALAGAEPFPAQLPPLPLSGCTRSKRLGWRVPWRRSAHSRRLQVVNFRCRNTALTFFDFRCLVPAPTLQRGYLAGMGACLDWVK